MFPNGRIIQIITVLFVSLVEASYGVKSLIFDNINNSVMLEFSEPIVVDNIFLMKKINDDELCVPVASLNEDIIFPAHYQENVKKLKETDPESKKYPAIKNKAEATRMEVLLSEDVFDNKHSYILKITVLDEDTDIYSEEFVYNEKGFEHKSSSDNNRWYSSPWPWIAIGFIILTALLLLKVICC